jgi:hypothetical protein
MRLLWRRRRSGGEGAGGAGGAGARGGVRAGPAGARGGGAPPVPPPQLRPRERRRECSRKQQRIISANKRKLAFLASPWFGCAGGDGGGGRRRRGGGAAAVRARVPRAEPRARLGVLPLVPEVSFSFLIFSRKRNGPSSERFLATRSPSDGRSVSSSSPLLPLSTLPAGGHPPPLWPVTSVASIPSPPTNHGQIPAEFTVVSLVIVSFFFPRKMI